ncbi:MAG TPA: DUF3617 domain-containing protein [Allosphingosinicella sp.]|jgi:hypothetical protein
MKNRTILATALLLAACGQQGGNNSQTAKAEGAAGGAPAASGGFVMEPGEWETTMLMDMGAVANLPPGVELPPARPITARTCITPEQVRDARAAFLGGGGQPGVECDYSGVTMAGGRISGTSICRSDRLEMTMTMDGSFTPTAYDVTQQMRSTIGGQTRESTGHMTGRRVGECPAGGGGK